MKITKDFEGLTRAENGDYVFAGDIITDESIEIELDGRLVVTGGIEAGEGIKACEGIEAGTFIASRMRIFAGLNLSRSRSNCVNYIRCAELRSGDVEYGKLEIIKQEE